MIVSGGMTCLSFLDLLDFGQFVRDLFFETWNFVRIVGLLPRSRESLLKVGDLLSCDVDLFFLLLVQSHNSLQNLLRRQSGFPHPLSGQKSICGAVCHAPQCIACRSDVELVIMNE